MVGQKWLGIDRHCARRALLQTLLQAPTSAKDAARSAAHCALDERTSGYAARRICFAALHKKEIDRGIARLQNEHAPPRGKGYGFGSAGCAELEHDGRHVKLGGMLADVQPRGNQLI